jgi:hypothetical protein
MRIIKTISRPGDRQSFEQRHVYRTLNAIGNIIHPNWTQIARRVLEKTEKMSLRKTKSLLDIPGYPP